MLESLWAAVDRVWLVSCKTLTVSLVDEMGTRLVVASVYCPTECNADTTGKYRFFHVAVEEPKGCSRVGHSSVVSVVCGDLNGELAAYHPSEMAAAGLGHVAAGVIGRLGMATAEPNCNRRRLHEEAAAVVMRVHLYENRIEADGRSGVTLVMTRSNRSATMIGC